MTAINTERPDGWGNDHVSTFAETLFHNVLAHYVHRPSEFENLVEIDLIYRLVLTSIQKEGDEFAALFLMRSHAAFLGASLLTMGGAVSDCPMLLRGCLEYALYGLHVNKEPGALECWFGRMDGADAKAKVRQEFQIKALKQTLEKEDKQTHDYFTEFYERSIDYGAHPNVAAIGATTQITKTDDSYRFDMDYLSSSNLALGALAKFTSEVGVCALMIFRLVYPTQYQASGIDPRIETLKKQIFEAAQTCRKA